MSLKFEYESKDDLIIVKNIDINLENTLFSGQAFRWNKEGDSYFAVCFNRVIEVYKDVNDLVIENIDKEFFLNVIAEYFDLHKDYDKIIDGFDGGESFSKSLDFAPGIRVLNQEPFETLISFIISANNNIKRIRLIIDNICKKCGEEIEYKGKLYYSFPTPEALASLTMDEFKECGAGYRAPYLKETATAIVDGFDLEQLSELDYMVARKKLVTLKGVGNKVADCVLLYAMGFTNAFPMDVWIKRVIHNLYGFESEKDSDILKFVEKTFGKYAGIAQQYLFYYVKENKIGLGK